MTFLSVITSEMSKLINAGVKNQITPITRLYLEENSSTIIESDGIKIL